MINVAHPENGMTALHLAVVRTKEDSAILGGQGAENWPGRIWALGLVYWLRQASNHFS